MSLLFMIAILKDNYITFEIISLCNGTVHFSIVLARAKRGQLWKDQEIKGNSNFLYLENMKEFSYLDKWQVIGVFPNLNWWNCPIKFVYLFSAALYNNIKCCVPLGARLYISHCLILFFIIVFFTQTHRAHNYISKRGAQ